MINFKGLKHKFRIFHLVTACRWRFTFSGNCGCDHRHRLAASFSEFASYRRRK